MRIGRPLPELVITPEDRQSLLEWARRPKSAQALALRAKIILACAAGKTNTEVADQFRVTKQMVGKWRARFWRSASMDCSMRLVLGHRARSATRRWSECWP